MLSMIEMSGSSNTLANARITFDLNLDVTSRVKHVIELKCFVTGITQIHLLTATRNL